MIKRTSAVVAMLAAVGGSALLAVPAHADDGWRSPWSGANWGVNRSANGDSLQTGNNFGDVLAGIRGAGFSTNVNNTNGIAATSAHGGITVMYIFD